MFRIESYITPIILSHIDKYVKDFRPKDAQVSLWGGAVSFQNLDLRLDVLEEELQLPFNFVSGHIHELTVLVPWTKIASEPIQITINTIEFVLKLKTSDDGSHTKRQRSSKTDVVQAAPPGYMASLVNKIANNISVKLHNIILKYVEEDIVVSMNIQLLSFDSADDNWNAAFIDISPTKVLLKKIINISDLTICLDKRNSLGKIDICQEPMLYRCTLQARMLRKYNISSAHRSSLTRIDIFTESIELNISAQQYPMLVRLLTLGIALREGRMRPTPGTGATAADAGSTDMDSDGNAEGSVLAWAWSLMPSLFPVEAIDENDQEKGHYLHTGMYVHNLKITFKSQELTGDSIVHTSKKIKYHPILKISLVGMYADAITLGTRWFNVKGGISYIGIYPLGLCTCGQKHSQLSIFTSVDILCDHRAFLEDSLMDPKCPENRGEFRSYERLWELHAGKVTEEYLLHRTPAIAFDVVHEVDVPDDMAHSSTLGSDLEYSNLSESYVCRAAIGSFNFKHSASLQHIIRSLNEYLARYDYPPYGQERLQLTRSQLSPPATEDYDALMADIPMRLMQLSIRRPVIEMHIGDHEPGSIRTASKRPFICLEFENVSLEIADPLYPNRLVHTTCQLPKPPAKLLQYCYTKYSGSFHHLKVSLCCGLSKQLHVRMPSCTAAMEWLLKPAFWLTKAPARTTTNISLDSIYLKMNKPQMIVLQHLLTAIILDEPLNTNLFESCILTDMQATVLPVVDVRIDRVTCTATTIAKSVGVAAIVSSISGLVYVPYEMDAVGQRESYRCKAFFLSDQKDTNQPDFFMVTLQAPIDFEVVTPLAYPPICILSINRLNLNMDPMLCDFLNYQAQPVIKRIDVMVATEPIARSPRKSVTKVSKKSSGNPVESVHSSSEPTAATITLFHQPRPSTKENNSARRPWNIFAIHTISRSLVLSMDVRTCTIYVPSKSLRLLHPDSQLLSCIKNTPLVDFAVIHMPSISIKSSHERNQTQTIFVDRKFPIQFPDPIWTAERDGFPWNLAFNDFSCYTLQAGREFKFVSPNKTKVTLAVTVKPKEDNKAGHDPSFAIHIDTAPIEFSLGEAQILFLRSSMRSLHSLLCITFTLPVATEPQQLEISDRPTSPTYQSELQDFFGTVNTMSENSSEETLLDYVAVAPKVSVWLQWTLAKFTIKLYGSHALEERKFIVELEDMITSIDEQDVYTKVKTKIGSLSGVCKTRPVGAEDWISNDVLGLMARSDSLGDSLQETFFDLTVTRALTKNVHNKWGTTKGKKNQNLIGTITEIMVNVQQIDVKLDVGMLATFLPVFRIFSQDPTTSPKVAAVTSVADLPLLFFQSKGLRVFVPMLPYSTQCNVLFFKINKISVSPTAENPLYRKPVRGDIYTKAAQLRILSIPGSKIEDRQYEIVFSNISLGSGKWEQILRYLDPSTDADAYNVNPAFDWNNLTIRPSIEVNTIFNRFNLSITYAPCIIFENILVCGQCVEINCVTDMLLELSTHEVLLLNTFYLEMRSLFFATAFVDNRTNRPKESVVKEPFKSTTILNSGAANESMSRICSPSEHQLTDSGFESLEYPRGGRRAKPKSLSSIATAHHNVATTKMIPFDMSFVGGIFSFKLYHFEHNESATVSDAESTGCNKRRPLFSATLFQPNVLISQSVLEKTTQLSLFNFNFKLGSELSMDKDTLSEFDDVLFETRAGDLSVFGIPPPLLHFHEHILATGEKNIVAQIKRPILIRFSARTLEKMLAIGKVLAQFTASSDQRRMCLTVLPITTSNKIKIIQNYVMGAHLLNVSLGPVDLDCSCVGVYNLKLAMSKVGARMEFSDHPQRLSFHGNVQSLVVNTGRFIMVNPLTMDVTGSLTKENWKRAPLVAFNVQSTCVDVSVGPENIVNLMKAHSAFVACLQRSQEDLVADAERWLQQDERLLSNASLMHIAMPKGKRIRLAAGDEHYQDDLRAGAFQFIDSISDDALPLPYQIQIIARDGGIICWRYPQPRALHYIQIFPVPFHSQSTKENKAIKCRLEYYSEAHNRFQPYNDFHLSEKAIQELQLPQRKYTAEIWRIIVFQAYVSVDGMHFQDDDSDSDGNDDDIDTTKNINEYLGYQDNSSTTTASMNILNPKALVGCMRIDSYFSANLVPNVEVAINIAHLTMSLKNNLPCNTKLRPMPDALRQYTYQTESSKDLQTFVCVYLRNIASYGSIFEDNRFTCAAEVHLSSSIFEFAYLTMQPLVEEFGFKFAIDVMANGSTDVNVVSDEMRLRYGQSVGHTLAVSEQLWRQIVDANDKKQIPHTVLATRYIVCNCTCVALKFGQVNTQEELYVRSKECVFYAFRSDRADQRLVFAIDSGVWTTAEPVIIAVDGTQIVRINDSLQYIFVKVEKISSTQKTITVKGQIELLNMCAEHIRVQYAVNNSQSADMVEPIQPSDLLVQAGHSMSVVGRCDTGISQCIKLRLIGDDRKGWSGEIPLHRTHKHTPWMVKVPSSTESEFRSFWVRVLRMQIRELSVTPGKHAAEQVLIVVWPFFMLRSLLTVDVVAIDKSTMEKYNVAGRGQAPVELRIAGTHETEHEIYFDSNEYFQNKAVVSYKALDRSVFFTDFDKFTSIDAVRTAMEKPHAVNWPCSREDELRWHRHISQQSPIVPVFRFAPSRHLSSSLQLEVVPSCLFINSIGSTIQLINFIDDNSYLIHSNNIGMPFVISIAFTIALYDTVWVHSCPIYTTSENTRSRQQPCYEIAEEGTAIVKIMSAAGLSKFQLLSTMENGIRVFILSPSYVICNHTTMPLNVWAFCMLQKGRHQLNMPGTTGHIGALSVPKQDIGKSARGMGITTFFNLSADKNDNDFNRLFNYFVAIRIGHHDYSVPVPLNKVINRMCFSISDGTKYIPLALSVIDHRGQTFVSIHTDVSPIIRLENRTDLPLYIGQAESTDPVKPSVAVKTLNDDNFEWFTRAPPQTTIFYTPPSIDASFPDKTAQAVAIIIANASSSSGSTKEICWSRSVKIYESNELFLNLPLYGDIKVVVESNLRTIKVTVDHINYQMEFNVKDIRTKILNPAASEMQSHQPMLAEESSSGSYKTALTSINPLYSALEHLPPAKTAINLNVFLRGIHVTLYADNEDRNYVKTELLAVYFDDVAFSYASRSRTLELDFSNFQVDNQLYASGTFDFPVLLCAQRPYVRVTKPPLPSPYTIQAFKNHHFRLQPPVCSVSVVLYADHSWAPEEVCCNMQPIRAYIEDKYINVLLEFLVENVPGNLVYRQEVSGSVREHCADGEVLVPKQILVQTIELAEPFRLRHVRIEPLKVLLSVHTCMRMYIALDHSPLDFAPFERRDIHTLPLRFGYHLGMHYVSGAIFGAGWVVGSLEILGSPSGLARSFSTGLRDFVSMPVQGFLRGPWGLLVGITQGSASLLRNITAGTVNSVTKLAASVARNLDRLSLDDDHLQRTEALRRMRPTGISDGFAQGLTGLGISILGAVGGLARHPLEAHSSVGVVAGLGRGLVGAVTKPISGAAELVALTGQGMLQTVGFNTMPIPRDPAIPKNCSIEPSAAKIVWKFLPDMFADDQVLFSGVATLASRLETICVAMTSNLIVVIAISSDEMLECYALDRAKAQVDANDATLIVVRLKGNSDEAEDDLQGFQYGRVLQYVQESSDQLPASLTESAGSLSSACRGEASGSVDVAPPSTSQSDHKIEFYMDEHLGRYFVEYVALIKNHIAMRADK